jgi:hypothetical protein
MSSMRQLHMKHRILVGAVALTAVAGGGIAYSANKTDARKAYLDDVAKRLDVTPEKLDDALKGAFLDRLDAAVKAGKLTQAQADAIKKKVEASGEVPFGLGLGRRGGPGGPHGGPGGPGFGGPGPGPRGGPGRHLDAAAKALGLTTADLRKQLEAGKSLADVAKAQGKSADDVKKALLDDEKAELDQAVTDGKLTAAQRDKILKNLDARIDRMVDGKFDKRGPGRFGRHGRFPGGPPPAAGRAAPPKPGAGPSSAPPADAGSTYQ